MISLIQVKLIKPRLLENEIKAVLVFGSIEITPGNVNF